MRMMASDSSMAREEVAEEGHAKHEQREEETMPTGKSRVLPSYETLEYEVDGLKNKQKNHYYDIDHNYIPLGRR